MNPEPTLEMTMRLVRLANPGMSEERIMERARQVLESLAEIDDEDTDSDEGSPFSGEMPFDIEKIKDSTWEIEDGGTITIKNGVNNASIENFDETRCAHDLRLNLWDTSNGFIGYLGKSSAWDEEQWWETFQVSLTIKYRPESDTIRGIIRGTDGFIASLDAKRKDDSSE